MSDMRLSIVAEMVDRASRKLGKIWRTQEKLEDGARATSNATDKGTEAIGRQARMMQRLGRIATSVSDGIARGFARSNRVLRAGAAQIGAGAGRVGRGMALAGGVYAAVSGGAALAANQLLGPATQFENFHTILEQTEGSSAKAEAAMGWVTDFAVKTPYELDQVMESFVQLRAYGLDPTNGLLETLGDTSAAMGKPMMQAVEAIADAVTGENERLKEFGIKAAKDGSQIVYEYTNAAGESVQAAVDANDRLGIQQTLMAIWAEKFGGAMGALSQTWSGMMGNLADLWLKFQLMIMQSGLFDWMKDRLKQVLDTLNGWEAGGRMQAIAAQIGDSIKSVLETAWSIGMGVVDIVRQVAGWLEVAAGFLGGWDNLAYALGGLALGPSLLSTAYGLLQIAAGVGKIGLALAMNPIGLAVMAIAGLAYLLVDDWGPVLDWFKGKWEAVKGWAVGAWQGIRSDWTSAGDWFGSLWSSLTSAASQAWHHVSRIAAKAWTDIQGAWVQERARLQI